MKKIILLSFVFIITNNLFSMTPTNQLFKAISENNYENVEKVIEKADLAARNPISGKSVLTESLLNFFRQAEKPLNLKIATFIAGLGVLAGGCKLTYIYGERAYTEGRAISIVAKIPSTESAKGLGLMRKSYKENLENATISFLTTLGSTVAMYFLGSSIYKTKKKISDAERIVNLILSKMSEKNILPDDESMNLMTNLKSQLKISMDKMKKLG